MNSDPRVHIVILNWNGWRDTLECLESVFKLDYPNFQVVVCDNDSSDNSLEQIESWARGDLEAPIASDNPHIQELCLPEIAKPIQTIRIAKSNRENFRTPGQAIYPLVLLETGGNLGFAGGNNVGLRWALEQGTDYCWLLNNDTVVEPDALSKMVTHSKALTEAGIKNTCGSVQCFYDDPEIVQALGGFKINRFTGICSDTIGRYLKRTDNIDHTASAKSLDTIQGCSWLIPRSYLEEIGLMEHSYFLYYEEIDWVTRAKERYQLTYAPDAVVYHKEGSSIGSKSFSSGPSVMAEFYTARARLMYMTKFYKVRLPLVYLTILLQAINRVRQKRLDNALMLIKVLFGKRSFS